MHRPDGIPAKLFAGKAVSTCTLIQSRFQATSSGICEGICFGIIPSHWDCLPSKGLAKCSSIDSSMTQSTKSNVGDFRNGKCQIDTDRFSVGGGSGATGSRPSSSSGMPLARASCADFLARLGTKSLKVVNATNCRGVKRSLHVVMP